MSNPKKHHFLPEFYLRRWVGADGRLTEFRRPHKALVTRRKFPSQTGFERELYSIKTREDEEARQELESGFLSMIDNDAARALTFLEEHRTSPADDRLRDGWIRFLMSLLHRSPYRVEIMRRQLAEREVEVLADIKLRWAEVRGPSDPETYEEYAASPEGKSRVDENLAVLLKDLMDSELIGNALARMHWGFGRLDDLRCGLMTSDSPVMVSDGAGHKDGFIALPTSPTTFFIAANRPETINAFRTQKNKALELALNDAVVRQARHLVIAADASPFTFIENRFLRGDVNLNDMNRLTWKSPLIDVPTPTLRQSGTSVFAYLPR
ncbi:MAG TPA: DUF4238 domain-containing protein [Allosphingosinicella sp.]|nr:DUF4238 domain-containing protein [Allosphingosinicella sp.]